MPTDERSDSPLPRRIGRYRIVRELGRGGMGTVYEALQENPLRTVALKVVTAGAMGPEALRRFELEAQVLGLLQHPGVAQIYEAGRTSDAEGGQPYFAMELVRGEPLGAYADRHGLDLRRRLELIAQVCDAVQHAHQRGVIHRDLKPGNILVDESGHARVLDFGVARATDSDLRTATLQTSVGQLVGTIPYMSPEQASGDPSRLDARSDVYSLGVVAYELLGGRLPYELDLRQVLEAVRAVREVDARPLSSIDARLRGDVETLVGKALEKDPDRRYASAAAFAEDIRNFLTDQPIQARPPSALYQLSKFARRNRALVGAAAGVVVALVAGLVGTSLGYFEARARRVEAEEAQTAAQLSALQARATSDFLRALLEGIDPAEAQGLDTTLLRRILADTERRIGRDLGELPQVEAEVRETIGQTYAALGALPAAEPHLRRAAELYASLAGPTGRDALRARGRLAAVLSQQKRFAEADPILTEAAAAAHLHLGASDPVTLTIDLLLCILEYDDDRIEASTERLEELLERMRAAPDLDPSTYVHAGITRSSQLLRAGQAERADAWLAELLARAREDLGPEHPLTLRVAVNHAAAQHSVGDVERALELYGECLDLSLRVYGPEDRTTLAIQRSMARTLSDQGRLGEAEDLLRRVTETSARVYGQESAEHYSALGELARAWARQERLEESQAAQSQVLEGLTRILGADHRDVRDARNSLASLYVSMKRYEEAEASLLDVLASLDVDPTHEPDARLQTLGKLADVQLATGRLDEALATMRETHRGWVETRGARHRATLRALSNVGLVLLTRGENAQAAELYVGMLDDYRAVMGRLHPDLINTVWNTHMAFKNQGRVAEAQPYLVEACLGYRERLGPRDPLTVVSRNELSRLFLLQDDPVLEATWRRAELALARAESPAGSEDLAEPIEGLAYALLRQELAEEPLVLMEEALELRSGQGLDDPRKAWSQALYGAALLFAERRDEAADMLVEAVDQLAGADPRRLRAAQGWLERL